GASKLLAALTSRDGSRSTSITLPPSAANTFALASPMLPAPPVTTQTLSFIVGMTLPQLSFLHLPLKGGRESIGTSTLSHHLSEHVPQILRAGDVRIVTGVHLGIAPALRFRARGGRTENVMRADTLAIDVAALRAGTRGQPDFRLERLDRLA